MMKRVIPVVLVLAAGLAVGGCASSNHMEMEYHPFRADLSDQPVEQTHNPPAAPPVQVVNSDPTQVENQQPKPTVVLPEEVAGTWTFTTPSTVTRVERKNGELDQFSLYNGRPTATQKPMVVITVAPAGADETAQATQDAVQYKVTGHREYVLNGNLAQEWTGLTQEGAAFCELIVKKPNGQGDVCHAMAIARTGEERKVALDVLASIVWKSNS